MPPNISWLCSPVSRGFVLPRMPAETQVLTADCDLAVAWHDMIRCPCRPNFPQRAIRAHHGPSGVSRGGQTRPRPLRTACPTVGAKPCRGPSSSTTGVSGPRLSGQKCLQGTPPTSVWLGLPPKPLLGQLHRRVTAQRGTDYTGSHLCFNATMLPVFQIRCCTRGRLHGTYNTEHVTEKEASESVGHLRQSMYRTIHSSPYDHSTCLYTPHTQTRLPIPSILSRKLMLAFGAPEANRRRGYCMSFVTCWRGDPSHKSGRQNQALTGKLFVSNAKCMLPHF